MKMILNDNIFLCFSYFISYIINLLIYKRLKTIEKRLKKLISLNKHFELIETESIIRGF